MLIDWDTDCDMGMVVRKMHARSVAAVPAGMAHNGLPSAPVDRWLVSDMRSPCVIDERQNEDQSGSCCCKIRSESQTLAHLAGVRKGSLDAGDCRPEAYFRQAES